MKHLAKFENFAYPSNAEIIEEGIFKKAGEFLGIRSMTSRLDEVLGFEGETFTPTRKLNLYLSQGETNVSNSDDPKLIPMDSVPMAEIEKVLRRARKLKYGVSSWRDEVNLAKMEGTDSEKEIAYYVINRAVKSIETTSTGGFN